MLAQSTKRRVKRLASAAIVLSLIGAFAAPRAFARITANTIDPVATVTDHGRLLIVTGPIGCAENEKAYLRVTVTQRATEAVAEGRTLLTCTGGTQQWEVHASVQGDETFEEGPATAVALARTADGGNTTDAHQWLVDIALVGEAR
jgi:hypothetical protein